MDDEDIAAYVEAVNKTQERQAFWFDCLSQLLSAALEDSDLSEETRTRIDTAYAVGRDRAALFDPKRFALENLEDLLRDPDDG